MSKTSSAVKRRYNQKAYDQIQVLVRKGEKDVIKAHAEKCGESVNGFINRAIKAAMNADNAFDACRSEE